MKQLGKRVLSMLLVVVMLGSMLKGTVTVTAAPVEVTPTIEELRNTKAGDYVSVIATPQDSDIINPDYDRSYDNYEEYTDGFLHPGILMNREELNIMRDMVWLGADPWISVFEELQKSTYASLDYSPNGPYEVISTTKETYALTGASTAVYELALMWYITGNQAYAEKSIGIMMDWSETVTAENSYDHIRLGISIHKFCIAAEIFRYTPSSGWTDEETEKLSGFLELVNPTIDKAFQYYNQGLYALMAFMAKNIFQNNVSGYTDAVERLAYNENHGWKGGYNVNYSLSAMVLNSGQVVEMGRDQEHAWDDLGCLSMVIKTTYVQDTKVDEMGNIVSTGGTDFYEYGNQKALKSAAYWQQYCLGEEPVFIANQNAWGDPTEWSILSNSLRGRTLMWSPSLYYHYLYVKGYEEDDLRTILEPNEQDPSTDTFVTYGDAYRYIGIGEDLSVDTYVRGVNIDFPDFQDLTFTPLAAIYDTPLKGAPQTAGDSDDNCESYNRYLANLFTASGSDDGGNGGVITEGGVDEEGQSHLVVSDLNNGEWIAYNIDFEEDFGENVDTLLYTAGNNSQAAPKVDVYIGEWQDEPTQDDYEAAKAAGKAGTVELGPTGGYTSHMTFSGTLDDTSNMTGKKTVYFYCYGSDNVYNYHGNIVWFKFVDSQATAINTGASADVISNSEADNTDLKMSNGGYAGWLNMDFDSGYSGLTLDISTAAAGKLMLYIDGPSEEQGGTLIHTYKLAQTDGEIQFTQKDQKAIIGRHAMYLVYEGSQLLLRSFTFQATELVDVGFEDNLAGNYTALIQGEAQKPDEDGLEMDAAADTYVTYLGTPFLEGADTLAVRVKSTGQNVLNFDLVTTDPDIPTTVGRNGNVASFNLPDTTYLSEDGYLTFYFDLSETGQNTLTGNVLLGMGASGNGTVEVEYFRLNPDNSAPQTQLYLSGTTEPADRTIYLETGESWEYQVETTDIDGDETSTTVYGELPAGFAYNGTQLTIDDTVTAGTFKIQLLVTDGVVNCIETWSFIIQGELDKVLQMIDDSGIESNLITYYVYARELYDNYMEAKEAALQEPGNTEKVQALSDAIYDCVEQIPVYTKVRFEYRITGTTGDITLHLDSKSPSESDQIAKATNLGTSTTVKYTDWLSFQDADGNSLMITGNHALTVNFTSAAIRLLTFTLANDDETVTKTIDAITITSYGAPNNFCVNKLDNTVYGGSIPHEVRGAASWLYYTWPDHDDYSDLELTDNFNHKASADPKWVLLNQTGPGFDFELIPKVITVVSKAASILGTQDLYTADSYEDFLKAYTAAEDAVNDYTGVGLNESMSNELADKLSTSMDNLILLSTLVTVEADEDNSGIMDFDPTGNTDTSGSNKSANPTVTAVAGEQISFLIKTDAPLTEPTVKVKSFGYRGSRGTSEAELVSIDPVLSADDIDIIDLGDGIYRVTWTGKTPGNYRVTITVTSGNNSIDKTVEMIYRNDTVREDFSPSYVRMRFAGFRKNEEKTVSLYLIKDGETIDESANKIAELSSWWDKDAVYALTDWVEIEWPADYDESEEYQLVAVINQRNTSIDFFEFATESYQQVYADSYQAYPLSVAGVMRIEAEHYDTSTMTSYDAVDFNGKNGWENGSPGKGTGSIGTTSSVLQCTVTYDNIMLSNAETAVETEAISGSVENETMLKGESQQIQVEVTPNGASDKFAFSSSNPLVASVDDNGIITAIAAGETNIYVMNADAISMPITINVADTDYLQDLMNTYDTYIAGHQDEYTTSSWEQMQIAYKQAEEALSSKTSEAVYAAANALEKAITERICAAVMTALDAYRSIAENLQKEDYTEASWAELQAVLTEVESYSKDNSQAEINSAAAKLQHALNNLVVLYEEDVDKTGLKDLYDECKALDSTDYTTESWAALETAIAAAKEVLGDTGATQDEVDDALKSLKEACDGLVAVETPADKEALRKLYDECEALNSADYTEGSWAALEDAMEAAVEVLGDTGATQDGVDDALKALKDAYDGLVAVETPVDKEALRKLYDECEALNSADYTADSWATLEDAMEATEEVLSDTGATQDEVDEALKALQTAISGLVAAGTQDPADKTDLQDLYGECEALDSTDYTADSWRVFDAALTLAKEVLDDDNATQAQVDVARILLQATYDGLVAVGTLDPVDKTDLQDLYDKCKALNSADYTVESWAALDITMAAAMDVLSDDDTTQEEISDALVALKNAYDGLVTVGTQNPVDKTDLQNLYVKYESLNSVDYTADSWTVFEAALTLAKEVLDNDNATQVQADVARILLQAAVDGLVAAVTPDPVDKTELQNLYDANKDLDANDYTADSWAALKTALTAAKEVLEDADAAQAQVNEALEALQEAVSGLVEVEAITYTVKGLANTGGTVAVETVVGEGKPAQITVNANDGYKLVAILVDGVTMDLTGVEDGVYTIENVVKDMALLALFVKDQDDDFVSKFVDVPETTDGDNTWYYEAVDMLTGLGIIEGTTSTTYEPEKVVTRAEFTKMLFELAKVLGIEAETSESIPFTDMPVENYWAVGYIGWAYENGIVTGYDDTNFGSEDIISRQDMALMMQRFFETYLGYDLTGDETIDFSDASAISGYAEDAVTYAVQKGLMEGYEDETYRPLDSSLRSEVAQVLYNYLIYIS